MTTQTRSEKDQYLDELQHEFAITQKLLKEYPAGKDDFRPAERCRTARELVWMFPSEEGLVQILLEGTATPTAPPPVPNVPVAEIAKMYETRHRAFIEKLRSIPAERFDMVVPFPTGKNQMGQKRIGEIAWFMLQDHVHHRGQFSVYLRMLGAKVPAIYGPSLDEPWR